MVLNRFILLALMGLISAGFAFATNQISAIAPRNPDVAFLDSLVENSSLEEKIGQLFFVPVNSGLVNEDDHRFKELSNLITQNHVGGLIFLRGDIYGQAILTNKLQRLTNIPLWITEDMENGVAMHIEGATNFTPPVGVAATNNTRNAFILGRIMAQEAKAMGVHQLFTPVLDVNNNPANPALNTLSFSSNPELITEYGIAFLQGVQSEGIIATSKHFPAHSDTKNVSLNFKEMVVNDELAMNGITTSHSPGRALVQALHTGADIMLSSPDIPTAIAEVIAAVEEGTISEERINKSFRKILIWKQQAGLFDSENQVDIERLDNVLNTKAHQAEADRIARESITILKDPDKILPIDPAIYEKVLFVAISDTSSGKAGQTFYQALRKYHPNIQYSVFDTRSNKDDEQLIIHEVGSSDLIVIGIFVNPQFGVNSQLPSVHNLLLSKLTSSGKKTVLSVFGNPYLVNTLENADVQQIAWANTTEQMQAAAPALFGASQVSGKLPVNISGLYEIGNGIAYQQTTLRYGKPEDVGLLSDELYKIDDILREAVLDSVFPGAVAAVIKDGVLVYKHGEGYHTYDKVRKVQESDVYDLASITKVVSTTASAMKLISEEKLSLEDLVGDYFPEFNTTGKSEITVRHLLLHESGLPAFRVYVDELKTRAEIIEAIKNEPLINPVGTTYVYSDLGMILLAEIVSKITNKPIDTYVLAELYHPIGMNSAYFNPKKVSNRYVNRIPPTEYDTVYRNQLIQAEVHDERAWYMDGIAGHAGLFASVDDLAKFGTMLLNKGTYLGKEYIKEHVVEQFTNRQSENSGRGLGFDRKSPTGFTTAGQLASNDTFGHLGFTGTSMWIDREKNMIVILLTNRTFPSRAYGKRISRIRAAVADAAFSSLLNKP